MALNVSRQIKIYLLPIITQQQAKSYGLVSIFFRTNTF